MVAPYAVWGLGKVAYDSCRKCIVRLGCSHTSAGHPAPFRRVRFAALVCDSETAGIAVSGRFGAGVVGVLGAAVDLFAVQHLEDQWTIIHYSLFMAGKHIFSTV